MAFAAVLSLSVYGARTAEELPAAQQTQNEIESAIGDQTSGRFSLAQVPAFSGQPYVAVNDNVPYFSDADLAASPFESYSDLDALGRCGTAYALVGKETMPTEERGEIGSVKPSGWHTVKYDFVDGHYLYNRCHLIGYQLTAENANEKNLITGTRYLNVDGMLPFENMVADYIKETGNHVLYRSTPVFEGNNLVATGVLMEAESVEDKGEGVLFCVFVYNAEPGVEIDYATGDSKAAPQQSETAGTGAEQQSAGESRNASQQVLSEEPVQPSSAAVSANANANAQAQDESVSAGNGAADVNDLSRSSPQETPSVQESVQESEQESVQDDVSAVYVLNTNSKIFHRPDCPVAGKIKASNQKSFTGSRADLIAQGYEPCEICKP